MNTLLTHISLEWKPYRFWSVRQVAMLHAEGALKKLQCITTFHFTYYNEGRAGVSAIPLEMFPPLRDRSPNGLLMELPLKVSFDL